MTTRAHATERSNDSGVIVGIRPEDIILLNSPENSGCFEGQVELTQNFGDERVVTIRVGKVSLNCLTGKNRVFTYGQKVYVKFKEEKAHVFLRETGIALARNTN
jgi:ABC-type sugar transport system ATPase subunit